ncbi:hypothetical protein B0T25DRAFT_55865 [Lasiosphaeria hispida]|uniref:Uncharacterized protein n=1 Tax=Lasiosphaeria hispida TaxID=260671 RepID=A0AAJ0HVZ6_9PEZI|nr:hypothetical protein B0T25DRAFT_55865 [Lasiosphaeria hispida]
MPQSTPSEQGDTTSVSSYAQSLSTTTSTARNSLLSRLRKARSIGDQLRDIKEVSILDLPVLVDDFPKLQSRKGIFIPETWAHHEKVHTSWIHNHGCWVIKLGPGNQEQGSFWVCGDKNYDSLYSAEAMSTATSHLNKIHQLFKEKEDDKRP